MAVIDLDAFNKKSASAPDSSQESKSPVSPGVTDLDKLGGTATPIAPDNSEPTPTEIAMSGSNRAQVADQHGFAANSGLFKGVSTTEWHPSDALKLAKNAYDLSKEGLGINLVRLLSGTDEYNQTVKTNEATLADIDSRMQQMVTDRQAGKPFNRGLWNDLTQRRTYVSNLQNATIDSANTSLLTRAYNHPLNTLTDVWSGLKKSASDMKDDPGKTFAGLVDGFFKDPELLLAGGEGTVGKVAVQELTKATVAAKAINTLTNATKALGMSGAKGAGIMAAVDVTQQMEQAGHVDPAETLGQAITGAVYGVAAKALHAVTKGDVKATAKSGDPTDPDGIGHSKVEADVTASNQFVADSAANPRQAVADVYSILGKDIPPEVKQNLDASIEAGASVQSGVTVEERLAANRAAKLKDVQGRIDQDYGVQSLASEDIELKSTQDEKLLDALHDEASRPSYLPFDLANEKGILNAKSFEGKPQNITLETKPSSVSKQLEDLGNSIRAPIKGFQVTTLATKQTIIGTPNTDLRIIPTATGEMGFVRNLVDAVGKPIGNLRGWFRPDGLHVVDASIDLEHQGQNHYMYNLADLADSQHQAGKILASDNSITDQVAHIYKTMGDKLGYDVVKNPDAVRDPVRNRWITNDGSPVYKVLGRAPDAPSIAGIQLQEAAEAVKRTGEVINQKGNVTVDQLKLLAGIGLTGTAAAYGYSKDHSILEAAEYGLGADAAVMALRFAPSAIRGVTYSLRTLGKEHFTLGDLGKDTSSKLNTIPLVALRMKHYIQSELPDCSNLFKRLMGDKTISLDAKEQQIHDDVRRVLNLIGGQARNVGVLKNFVDDYFTRWWKPGESAPQDLKDDWNRGNFRKHRSLAFGTEGLEQAAAKGLVPVTDNVGEIVEAYINSMSRSIAMKQFIDGAKDAVLPNGNKMVYGDDSSKMPKGYVRLKGLMQGSWAHPDVAPEINFFTHYPDPSFLGKAYDVVNYAMKRGTLGFSLFHPMSLFRNYVFTTGRPQDLISAFNPNSAVLRSIKYAPAVGEDMAMNAAKSGLVFSIKSTPEDFGNDLLYRPLETLTNLANDKSVIAGSALKLASNAYKLNDRIAFEWNQNYYKLHAWTILRNQAVKQALNNHLKMPDKFDAPDVGQIEKNASSTVNDLFGSLNWYRVASESRSWLARNVMLDAFNPVNRVGLQRGILALDWSTSVIRSFAKALYPLVGENSQTAAMHRRFLMGMGLTAFTVANAVNYHFSNKWIWENENPGYIDLGDGRKLQWDKQLAEISEWLSHPGKAALNKMAELPKEGLEATANRQYITPGEGAPKIYGSDDGLATIIAKQAAHAGGKFTPIAARQPDLTSAGSSFVGLPIYPNKSGGKTSMKPNFGPPKQRNKKMY